MRNTLILIALLISNVLVAIAQVPNRPAGEPTPPDTVTVPFSQNKFAYLVFAGFIVVVAVGIFAGRKYLKKLGVKSNKTSDSEGGIQ